MALACRTLHSLALAAPLLHSVHVVLWGREDADQRLDLLCRWLQNAAAGRVRRLELELGLPSSRFDMAALQAALAAQSDLQELRLALSGLVLPLGGWVAALPLHTLCIDQLAGPLVLEASVQWPPGLQVLRLHGRPLQLRANLPESLTRLELGWLSDEDGVELPQQVGSPCPCLAVAQSSHMHVQAELCVCLAALLLWCTARCGACQPPSHACPQLCPADVGAHSPGVSGATGPDGPQ